MFKSGQKLHFLRNVYLRLRFGAGCCDVQTLWYFLAPLLRDALIAFKKNKFSYPNGLTPKEWDNMLDEMIWAFNFWANDTRFDQKKKDIKRADRGTKLFGKWFRDLWS